MAGQQPQARQPLPSGATPRRRKWKRLLLLLLLLVALFPVLVIGLFQLYPVRSFFLDFVESAVNDHLLVGATLHIGDVSGTLWNSLVLKDVLVRTPSDTLLAVPEVVVTYNLEALLRRKVAITQLTLSQPRVYLRRKASDSLWNYQQLRFRSDTSQAAASMPWHFVIERFQIKGGSIEHIDAQRLREDLPRLVTDRMALDSLNLIVRLAGSFDGTLLSGFVQQLQFTERFSHLQVRRFRGTFHKLHDALEIFNTSLLTTHSAVQVSGRIEHWGSFQNMLPVPPTLRGQLLLDVDSLDPAELRLLFPTLPLGKLPLRMYIASDLENQHLAIRQFKVQFGNSQLQLRGKVVLNEGMQQLPITLSTVRAEVFAADLQRLIALDLPVPLRTIKRWEIKAARFEGTPRAGKIHFTAVADNSTLESSVYYDLRQSLPGYGGTIQFRHLNLQQLIGRAVPETRLTGYVEAHLRGQSLPTLEGSARIALAHSRIGAASIGKLIAAVHADQRRIVIDSLVLFHSRQQLPNVLVQGWLAKELEQPPFSIAAQLQQLQLRQLFPDLPFTISANFKAAGKGITPDTFIGQMQARVDQLDLEQQSFLPFSFHLESEKDTAGRHVRFTSSFATAELHGRFQWRSLLHAIMLHSTALAQYFLNASRIFADTTLFVHPELPDSLHCTFALQLENAAYLQPLLPGFALWFQATLRGELHQIAGQYSALELQSLQVENFAFSTARDTVQIFQLGGQLQQRLQVDSVSQQMAMHVELPYGLRIGGLDMLHGVATVQSTGEQVQLQGSALFGPDSLLLALKGHIVTDTGRIQGRLDSLYLHYRQLFWRQRSPVRFYGTPTTLVVEPLVVEGAFRDTLQVSGVWDFGRQANVVIQLANVPIAPYGQHFFPFDSTTFRSVVQGRIRQGAIVVQGDLQQPQIDVRWITDTLKVYGYALGILQGNLRYRYQNWGGEVAIHPLQEVPATRLQLFIQQLPMTMDFATWNIALDTLRPWYLTLSADDMPLQLLQPLLPFVAELSGIFQTQLQLSGYFPNRFDYRGEMRIASGQFVVPATNVSYRCRGHLLFRRDTVFIDSLAVFNEKEDLPDGYALAHGAIFLRGFALEGFDIQLHSTKLLVMNYATQAVSPNLYGTLIIRTRQPLRLFGSLNLPWLNGEVDVLKADLIFPEQQSVENFQQLYCYERIVYKDGKRLFLDRNCSDEVYRPQQSPTPQSETAPHLPALQPGFLERLHYYLVIRFITPVLVRMDFSPFEQLVAELEAPEPLYYMTNPLTGKPEFYGELIVQEGSTYRFYRIFSTRGKISFRTGLDNPELDLVAELRGKRFVGQEIETYRVVIFIEGTKKAPKLRFAYYINGEAQPGDPQEVQANSIFLILFGRTKDEFQQGSSDPQLMSVLSSGLSSGLSKFITTVLQSTGIVRSADIVFQQSDNLGSWDLAQAEIRLRGEIAPLGLLWQYGGEVGDISRATFEINFPLGSLTNVEALRGLVLQIRRSVIQAQSLLSQQREYEIKILYRYSW